MRRLSFISAFTLCFLIFWGNAASAEKWVLFATDEDGVHHYYDESSVKWIGAETVQAWDRWELSGEDRREFMRDTGTEAGYVRSLVELRCRSREHRSVRIVYQGEKGAEILSFDDPSAGWEDILPGSVTDLLHTTLCIYGKYSI